MFEPTAIYAPNPHRYDTMTYNRARPPSPTLSPDSPRFRPPFGGNTPSPSCSFKVTCGCPG